MRIDRRSLAIAFVSTCLTSCSTSNPQPPIDTSGSGSGSGSGGVAVGDDDSGSSADAGIYVPTGDFAVTGILTDATQAVIAGAEMCLFTLPTGCVSTTTAGAFTLNGLTTGGSGIGITGAQTGYVNGVWPLQPTSNLNSWSGYLRTPAQMTALAAAVNAITWSATTGVVHFLAFDGSGNDLSGVTVTTSAGGTIGYFTMDGSTLNTSTTGVVETTADGGGMVFGLTAGTTVDVIFAAQGKTCVRSGSSGWTAVAATSTMSVPIVAGAVTFAGATCA